MGGCRGLRKGKHWGATELTRIYLARGVEQPIDREKELRTAIERNCDFFSERRNALSWL
jgi:hypothetical protein